MKMCEMNIGNNDNVLIFVFTEFDESPVPLLMTESFCAEDRGLNSPRSPDLSHSAEAAGQEDALNRTELEEAYRSAVKLISVNKELSQAPAQLKAQCQRLQELSDDLSLSIRTLQEKARIVNSKNLSPSKWT